MSLYDDDGIAIMLQELTDYLQNIHFRDRCLKDARRLAQNDEVALHPFEGFENHIDLGVLPFPPLPRICLLGVEGRLRLFSVHLRFHCCHHYRWQLETWEPRYP